MLVCSTHPWFHVLSTGSKVSEKLGHLFSCFWWLLRIAFLLGLQGLERYLSRIKSCCCRRVSEIASCRLPLDRTAATGTFSYVWILSFWLMFITRRSYFFQLRHGFRIEGIILTHLNQTYWTKPSNTFHNTFPSCSFAALPQFHSFAVAVA